MLDDDRCGHCGHDAEWHPHHVPGCALCLCPGFRHHTADDADPYDALTVTDSLDINVEPATAEGEQS